MEWIINQLRVHPELAIFLTLFAGFWLGRLKIGKFSLGTVTSAGRSIGRTTEYHCRWSDESCVLSAFLICRWL